MEYIAQLRCLRSQIVIIVISLVLNVTDIFNAVHVVFMVILIDVFGNYSECDWYCSQRWRLVLPITVKTLSIDTGPVFDAVVADFLVSIATFHVFLVLINLFFCFDVVIVAVFVVLLVFFRWCILRILVVSGDFIGHTRHGDLYIY